ncbi:MAG: phage tail assembly protein [Rhodocyclaceae bacterium]|nr:phage tail assembly protein [Rhodocyclaceae bacterium]
MERIPLTFPIEHDGVRITEVGLRRPTVGDHLVVAKLNLSDAEREVRLIANLSELPPEAVLKLDLKDYAAIQRALSGFLS